MVSTTHFRDLSCYTVKDILRSVTGTCFLVCIDTKPDFGNLRKEVAAAQRSARLAGKPVHISGRVYYTLAGTLCLADSNNNVRLGMTRGQFEREYSNSGEFGMTFDEFSKSLTFSWQDVSTRPLEVMFFGRKFEGGGDPTTSCSAPSQISNMRTISFGNLPRSFVGMQRPRRSCRPPKYQKRLKQTWQNKYSEALAQ